MAQINLPVKLQELVRSALCLKIIHIFTTNTVSEAHYPDRVDEFSISTFNRLRANSGLPHKAPFMSILSKDIPFLSQLARLIPVHCAAPKQIHRQHRDGTGKICHKSEIVLSLVALVYTPVRFQLVLAWSVHLL